MPRFMYKTCLFHNVLGIETRGLIEMESKAGISALPDIGIQTCGGETMCSGVCSYPVDIYGTKAKAQSLLSTGNMETNPPSRYCPCCLGAYVVGKAYVSRRDQFWLE